MITSWTMQPVSFQGTDIRVASSKVSATLTVALLCE